MQVPIQYTTETICFELLSDHTFNRRTQIHICIDNWFMQSGSV